MASLRQLYDQKRTVLTGMENSQNMISDLENKISRLQKASGNLATSVSELEIIKNSVSRLTIDIGRWKGKEKSNFEEEFDNYKESVEAYVSRTEDAKDTMDQDIRRYEADKAAYTTGLSNLENTLAALDRQIIQAQKG